MNWGRTGLRLEPLGPDPGMCYTMDSRQYPGNESTNHIFRDSLVQGSALQCDTSHSARSEPSVPDRRLYQKGVGSPTSLRCHGISRQRGAANLSRTRREHRLPLGGLIVDGAADTSFYVMHCECGNVRIVQEGKRQRPHT